MAVPDATLLGLPAAFRAVNAAQLAELADGALRLRAGAGTDWFVDPAGTGRHLDAPALLTRVEGSWMLRARVSAEHASTFDAGVLVVYADERRWAKLCLELSPRDEVMVVSVVTKGVSDDCNGVVIDGPGTWLRVSRVDDTFAFHHSEDGATWRMVRYFSLEEPGPVEVGFLAQSPMGPGCTARFDEVGFSAERLSDLRSGA